MNSKILSKRIPKNEKDIFYKQIINENAKEVDKVVNPRWGEFSLTLRYTTKTQAMKKAKLKRERKKISKLKLTFLKSCISQPSFVKI